MKVKYPRTFHLPWSEGTTSDDKKLTSVDCFYGRRVVVTEKMDGQNITLYSNTFHARSLDSAHHQSQDWLANFHGTIKHNIPDNWRICGENLYAKHSIAYTNLPSYFLGFSIWDDRNTCLSWDETLEWFQLIGIFPVRTIWEGVFIKNEGLHQTFIELGDFEKSEGYVIRTTDRFQYDDFSNNVAKYVRKDHVQTDKHWMHAKIVPNQLAV